MRKKKWQDGVIEVVHRLEEAEDSDLKRLKEIGKVEPLVKIQEKGFTLESVLSLKSSGKLVTNKHIGKCKSFYIKYMYLYLNFIFIDSADSLADTLFDIQDHIATQMSQVNSDQVKWMAPLPSERWSTYHLTIEITITAYQTCWWPQFFYGSVFYTCFKSVKINMWKNSGR